VAIRRRGNKTGFGGTFAGSRYDPKVNAEYERALQLDPNYPHAYLVMGHKYFFTPQVFGGNLDKAIESFQEAATLDPHYDESYVWLAIAHRKKGRCPSAETAVGEALRVIPEAPLPSASERVRRNSMPKARNQVGRPVLQPLSFP
jgi:tetratricopeptide (TPR) repeat protein